MRSAGRRLGGSPSPQAQQEGGCSLYFHPPAPRCLVHIVRSTSLKYSKIRQFQEHFQFDVCRHEVRYGCLREDSCHFAHSFIELKVWLLQQYSGGAGQGRLLRGRRAGGERGALLGTCLGREAVLPKHHRGSALR